jgi:hypothetical protein
VPHQKNMILKSSTSVPAKPYSSLPTLSTSRWHRGRQLQRWGFGSLDPSADCPSLLSRSGSPSSRTSYPPRQPAEGEDRPAASASERGHGPQSAASAASRLDLKEEPSSAVCCLSCCPAVTAWSGTPCSDCCDLAIEAVLSAGRGRPARTPFGGLGRALPVVAPAPKCGVCCLSRVGPGIR